MTTDPTLPPAAPPDAEGETPLPEQPETDLAPAESEIPPENIAPPTNDRTAARTQLAEEIRASRRLPRGLRERLSDAKWAGQVFAIVPFLVFRQMVANAKS